MESRFYIEYQDNSVELPLGETVVGRDVGCKLRFNDPSVSRRHLRFIRRADEVFVEDLESRNGTLVNGHLVVVPTRLDDGDAVVVGGRTLFVRCALEDHEASQTVTAMPEVVHAIGTQPVAVPQRCPSCGSVVIDLDDECATCRYAWGFRAARKSVAPRRDARLPVELPLVYVSNELEIEATSRDLSTSGVFVVSQVLEPIGTACTLTFLGGTVEIHGVVRRVVDNLDVSGLGVEFSPLGPTEKRWLEALVARLAK